MKPLSQAIKIHSLNKFSYLTLGALLIQMNPAFAEDVISIDNIAEADYQVSGHEDVVQTQVSNKVNAQAFTAPRYGISLTSPAKLTLTAGEKNKKIAWRNFLENTGTATATVDFDFAVFSPTYKLSAYEFYIDRNNNGEIDAGDERLVIGKDSIHLTIEAKKKISLITVALSDNSNDGDDVSLSIDATIREEPTAKASIENRARFLKPSITYKDDKYSKEVTQITAGQPAYIEVQMAACNNPNQKDFVWVTVKSGVGDEIQLKAVETGNSTGIFRVSAPTEFNANPILTDQIIQTLTADLNAEAICGSVKSSGSVYGKVGVVNDDSTLSVNKIAHVSTAEVGDFVDYTVEVKNTGTYAINSVKLVDELPLGFTYVQGSVRVNNQPYTQDFQKSGKYMTLGLGNFSTGGSTKVTYRVAIEPTALGGTGTNIAFASGNSSANGASVTSTKSSATVKVTNSRLSTDGIIIGKVYADFNRDGIQQKENNELGVAGVRLYLEDGTFVVTDSEGKYSLYGISAKTHVIKLDRTTLPRDVELVEQSNRNMGDAGSRFVDLKHGELHRADFAITDGMGDGFDSDSQDLIAELKKRAKLVAAKNDALEQAVKSNLDIEPQRSNTTNIEAEGCLKTVSIDGQISCDAVLFDEKTTQNSAARLTAKPVAPVQELEIEKALSTSDDKRIEGVTADADFLNLKDGQLVGTPKIRVQIKAPQGAKTVLLVNNQPVDSALMAKEVAWEKERISGFDYFAVPLEKGNNVLTIQSTDATGKLVSSKSITVHAPERISRISARTQEQNVQADGVSEYQIVISLKDNNNVLYAASTPVTLDADIGTVMIPDMDKEHAGVQTMIEGGELLVTIKAPTVAGKGSLVVKAGTEQEVIPLQFVPKLRPMIAAGIVEGVISFNNLGSGLEQASKNDGFEEELKSLSDSGNTTTHGRAAFFLKGKVRGDYLLTMAYDSDKGRNERLFRDIQPDEYYPVYGDASAKGFDAQSTSKFYVRLDKGRSFAMYGDIKTHVDNEVGLSLGQYDRTLTGIKGYYEYNKTRATTFVAQTKSSQKVNETRGLGISGPYPLAQGTKEFDAILANSETVEVIVRDRNNPGVILSRKALSRFSDYDIDSLSKALYLREPIASQDIDGNPIYLRVTVESEGVGDDYLVWGASASRALTDKIKIGASYAQSDDPTNQEKLASANLVFDINDKTKLVAETAKYDADKVDNKIASQINTSSLKTTSGQASRIELTYKDIKYDAKVYYNQADEGFTPTSSPIVAGRIETGLKFAGRLNPKTQVKAEAVRTEEQANGSIRQGASVSLERRLSDHLVGEIGVRYYDKQSTASTNYQTAVQTTDIFNQSKTPASTVADNYSGTTLRGKLTAELPKINKSKLFVEYEQDINDSSRKAWSVGGETSLFNKGRLYARHELSSSLTGDYGLDANNERQSTIVGVDANYMKDGQVFSEYRLKDGVSSRESEAAIGLRNKFKLKDGVYVNTSFERLQSLEGNTKNDATAATIGLDYLASDDYKFTTRLEKRWGVQTDTLLNTLGYAHKVNDDVTILAKNNFSLQEDNQTGKQRTLDRFQLGAAYRDYNSNVIDALAKLEYRYDNNEMAESAYNKQTYIASLHANYHPVRRLTLSGHYAGKWNELTMDNLTSKSNAQLVSGRVMYDINERWDAGVQAGAMWSDNNKARYLLGAEVGYSPMANLWLSLGYNFAGYQDDDIANGSENQQGAYFRLRFKFDEDLFKRSKAQVNTRMMPNDEIAVK